MGLGSVYSHRNGKAVIDYPNEDPVRMVAQEIRRLAVAKPFRKFANRSVDLFQAEWF